jgi:hypothetical protein
MINEGWLGDTYQKVKSNVHNAVNHYGSPLHIYSRLRDVGLKKDTAKKVSSGYEKYVYKPIVGIPKPA